MRFENLHLRLETILDRELELGHLPLTVTGTSSPTSVALLLSQSISKKISNLPHLVVFPRLSDCYNFQQALAAFDPQRKCEVLNAFDVSPYSGLYPKSSLLAERLNFLLHAHQAKPGEIFVVPIVALQQKTLPYSVFVKNLHVWKAGTDIPENLNEALQKIGYSAAPLVEDVGQYALRGGILDIFSAAHSHPVRIELFGNTIESLRIFSASDQRSLENIDSFSLIPCREFIWNDDQIEKLVQRFKKSLGTEYDKEEFEETLRALTREQTFPGIDFLLPFFYDHLSSPLEFFNSALHLWIIDALEVDRQSETFFTELKDDYKGSTGQLIRPPVDELFSSYENLSWPEGSQKISFNNIDTETLSDEGLVHKVSYSTQNVLDLSNQALSHAPGTESWIYTVKNKISSWKADQYSVFINVKNKSQIERLKLFFEKMEFQIGLVLPDQYLWNSWHQQQQESEKLLHLIPHALPESLKLPEEKIIFLKEEDLLGRKQRVRESGAEEFQKRAQRLSFGDLKPGDCVVHVQHGIGVYDGLKVMDVTGVQSEFIQISYKDKDKLYLPVYRISQIQKYSGAGSTAVLDKLGGTGWEKTKTKVKAHLRDIANELLELYAKRAELHRPAFEIHKTDFAAFESSFTYEETEDQLRSINDIVKDLSSTKPMDRLICGDVGFGKTEVAMRGAFVAVESKKQVAVLAPTTVLSFQHLETFKKRFHGWPVEIRALNRFVSNAEAKKTLQELKDGKIDILIGTHRIFSRDVEFKNLGLLIIDEEQRFGVSHKEKIKKMRVGVDTLTMSATPIPRTLNMSLVGIRDLSLINTAPVDRLPTRTFICKFDEETIRKAIKAEIDRGGQVYFIHNRIQSIYGLADQIRQIVPEARIKIGHGQMDEGELEQTMIQFFNHEIDVLICTTIVESGMDVPRANTMFIDQAHMMGLSQLYQLRGRVGRSKERAYCYLIVPNGKKLDADAQERLKVIQENTALGSGIQIAQYDLELRGAGNLLGEDQSGHVNTVGYELYMDLLNEAIHTARGEPVDSVEIEPEINLRIPAMIPDNYISDIRIRLSYYKALTEIRSVEDVEKFEEELKDQFGTIPEPTMNLLGLMLIRSQCRQLGVKDISSGLKRISLMFTDKTPLKPEAVIKLATRENKKYAVTPDNRLNIRINELNWPAVHEELQYLLSLI